MSAPFGWLQGVVLRRVPSFLRGPNYSRFLEAYAATLDGLLQTLRLGLTFGNPLLCPEECLPTIERDRNIPIYPSTPIATQRLILADWLMLHRVRGSHYCALRMLRYFFASPGPIPAMRIVHQAGDGASCEWHEMSASGKYTVTRVTPSNFNYDAHPTWWARWHLIIDASVDGVPVPALNPCSAYDDGSAWDGGEVWDGVDVDVARAIVSVAQWGRRGGTRLQCVIVNRQPGTLGPSTSFVYDPAGWTNLPIENWGSPYFGGVATRPPYLDFIYDVGTTAGA